MPNMTCKLTPITLALFAVVASAPLLAQNDRWFKVELLVFANETTAQPEGASIAEQWEATPTLIYPLASRFLVDSERVAENATEFDGESLVDEYGRQIITILAAGEATDTAVPDPTPPAVVPVPPTPVYQGGAPADAAPARLAPVTVKPLALPRPFVLLPGNYQEFRGKAALMQRGGRYTVLFHETWVQPVTAEKRSLPIVLDRSGDTQQWSRLQGTINLYLSRYLHVQTNLWLNTAGEYLAGTWHMPAPPLGPPSLIIEEQEMVDIAAAVGELPAAAVPGAEDAADELEVTTSGAELANSSEVVMDPGDSLFAQDPNNPLQGEEFTEVEDPVYPYRHAVLLEQTRRMRSNEIHYIDHPLLGVVIKFTPITAEQLDAIATEQQPPAGDGNQPL
jgi:hypothetical protein